jgi:2-dehydro-3-deoxyphosphogluconate aldolase/(4S)-4-hydroxy-2-oxoglutarate aldolase
MSKLSANCWLDVLRKYRLIAVIRCSNLDLGLKMAKAVARAGVSLIEITWNSQQPQQLISKLREELPDCFIGAGTILTPEYLQTAIKCGAQFLFSPHVNLKLIETALSHNIPLVPGTLSATEIVSAYQAGASCVKVFPIEAVGGVNYIKSLQGPLGHIPLIPTGGVTLDNAAEFIIAGAIAVGLSSQLFPPDLVLAQDWSAITQRASRVQKKLSA